MREMIIGDAEFRKYMDVRWGVNLLGQSYSQKGTDGALDPWYFWDPAFIEKQNFNLHLKYLKDETTIHEKVGSKNFFVL